MISSIYIPVITKLIDKRHKFKLRMISKGYKQLKNKDNLQLLDRLKSDLTGGFDKEFSDTIFTKIVGGVKIPSVALKQYYIFKIISATRFNKAVLYAHGTRNGISFPLPLSSQRSIVNNNIAVNRIMSTVLWILSIIKRYLIGVAVYFRSISKNIIYSKVVVTKKKYIRFYGLSNHNLPIENKVTFDTVSWFLRYMKGHDIEAVVHDVLVPNNYVNNGIDIYYSKDEIPAINNVYHFIKFIINGLLLLIYSFVKLLCGQWQYAFLLGELIKALELKYVGKNVLPFECMFNNSEWIYRPLWSYVAESRGCNIQFYFYSTNIEQFKFKSGYQLQPNNWDLCTWSNYLVWDKCQENFIRREVKYFSNIKIVGHIWGTDCDKVLQNLPVDSIAVFDIQPTKPSVYMELGLSYEYYTPEVIWQFIDDIYDVFNQKNNLALKQKRRVEGRVHEKYSKLINELEGEGLDMINPCVSAIRVIDACKTVISLPFTSTALIGMEAGKTSIYYDPTGKLQKDDRAAHGIILISEKKELEQWAIQAMR